MIGKATADISSVRARVEAVSLSCVLPDGTAFERQVKGYFTGEDGTLGVPGRWEFRSGRWLANLLSAMGTTAAGLYADVAIAQEIGGTNAILGGISTADVTDRIQEFFLARAEEILPVVWVESGTPVYVVMLEGLTIEGLPVRIVLPVGSGRVGLRRDRVRYGFVLVAVVAVLLAGCSPKPYMGDARDLHEAMGSRRDAVVAPALEASPAALGPEAPYLPLVQPPRGQAGVGDGPPEPGGRHDCRALGVPDAGAVVVVPALPWPREAGTTTAGEGTGGAGKGEVRDGRDRAGRPPAVRFPVAARSCGWRPGRRHHLAAGAEEPEGRRAGVRVEGAAAQRGGDLGRGGGANGDGAAGAVSQPGSRERRSR